MSEKSFYHLSVYFKPDISSSTVLINASNSQYFDDEHLALLDRNVHLLANARFAEEEASWENAVERDKWPKRRYTQGRNTPQIAILLHKALIFLKDLYKIGLNNWTSHD